MAQEQLRDVWLQAQHGRLCAWEQAKALALREASCELHGRTQLEWIAARVEKTGGGHPNAGALHKFFKMVDADKEWFPGKQKGARRGAKPLMTRAKRRCIARSAMAAKKSRGDELGETHRAIAEPSRNHRKPWANRDVWFYRC